MNLLRTSSTPIMSSKVEAAGGGSSRNSSKTSFSKTKNNEKASFPIDPSSFTWQLKGIRRVSSDGNPISTTLPPEEQAEAVSPKKIQHTMSTCKPKKCKPKPKLDPIPSFSVYNRGVQEELCDEEVKNIDDYDMNSEFSFPLMNSINRDDSNGEFGFFNFSNWDNSNRFRAPKDEELHEHTSLYMATGLGIDPDLTFFKQDEHDNDQMQQYYTELVIENPCNPLILRNYAQYLYKTGKDYKKAEELYSRAILADPNDGEILSEYAKLRWEIHGEQETASNYFVSAVHASPENSNVLAAYASFLWETDEREELQDTMQQQQQ